MCSGEGWGVWVHAQYYFPIINAINCCNSVTITTYSSYTILFRLWAHLSATKLANDLWEFLAII